MLSPTFRSLCSLISFTPLLISHALAQTTISNRTIAKIDQALFESVNAFNLPSLSIAIVHQGELIWSHSYGEREAGSGSKSTTKSLYAVASNTKAFTSAALAQLVDSNLIAWDDPVQKHLPWFEMYDPYVTATIRVRDLLCHNSGLATFSGDLLWYGSDLSSEEVLRKSKHLKPSSPFRSQFGYQNLMFMAAGQIIESITGSSWKDHIQKSLLTPCGMDQAVLSISDLTPEMDVALPHNEKPDGRLNPIEWVNWDNMAPAGGLISSVDDMARWMIVQLDSGRTESGHLWDSQRTQEMWQLHTPIPVSNWYRKNIPSIHFRGYGLGWELYTIHGKKAVAHSGGYDGMISRQILIPEEKIGVFLATNVNSSAPWAWGHDILGMLLEQEDAHPIVDIILEAKRNEASEQLEAESTLQDQRVLDAPPSHQLSAYAGTFEDAMYGPVHISLSEDTLRFSFGRTPLFKGWLEPWHFETYRLHWSTEMMLPKGMAFFEVNMNGDIEGLDFDVINPDFDFTELHFERSFIKD